MPQKQKKQLQKKMASAYGDYEKKLNIHALLRVSNLMIGEDLVQKTFIKTWIYLAKGGKIDLMKAFLYHVLDHLIIDHYRKHKAISLDVLLEKGFEPSNNPSEHLSNVIDGKMAFLLIRRLPKKYQKVLTMRYAQDLSLEEMSILTGQSKKTISVQLYRGLKQLKLLYSSSKK